MASTAITTEEAREALNDPTRQRDELEDEFDDFDIPSEMREARYAALQYELEKLQQAQRGDHGSLREAKDEKEVFDITTKTPLVICHFYHKDFKRCEILNKHLETLATKHFGTKFIKCDVDTVPFLVIRLKIQVLPALLCFVDGVVKDKVVGFEDFGNKDNFTTAQLERRLATTRVITLAGQQEASLARKTVFGFAKPAKGDNDSDEDD